MTASSADDKASLEHRIRELTKELSHARGELAEARGQQAASAEILRVISSSPMDLQRVFTEIAAGAARLCDAYDAAIAQVDGNNLHLVAHHGPIPTPATFPLTRGFVIGRAIFDRRTILVADLQAQSDEYPEGSERARELGHRTIVCVPLIRAGEALGVISVRRTEARLFSEEQIALLETFANQAVIAIENTRLFEAEQARTRELGEALDQQTSSAKVLSAISTTPGQVQPLFDTMLQEATRVCEAEFGVLHRFDGTTFVPVATCGGVPELINRFKEGHHPSPTNALGRILRTKQPVHFADVREGPGYQAGDPAAKSIVEIGGARSYLLVLGQGFDLPDGTADACRVS